MISVRLAAYDYLGVPDDTNKRRWLAGSPASSQSEHSSVFQGTRNHTRTYQEISGPGYAHVDYEDRENERSNGSFSTTRLFTSALEAWLWRNMFADVDPTVWPHELQGMLIERFTKSDGTWQDRYFYKAVMQKPTMQFDGVTLKLNYAVSWKYSQAGLSGVNAFLAALGVGAVDAYLVDDNGVLLIADSLV